jgi:hypothetical protein
VQCNWQAPQIVEIGDQNADGVADFAIAAPTCLAPGTTGPTGTVYVYSGANGALLRTITPVATAPSYLISLAAAGDQDGDGIVDVVVGAPQTPYGLVNAPGEMSVFSGATGSLIRRIPGSWAGVGFGAAVASMPDLDGDGVRELVVSSHAAQNGSSAIGAGAVDVISGATGATLHSIPGSVSGSSFGISVAGLGDFDGDGAPDFAVGASAELGVVRVYSGATGAQIALEIGEAGQSLFGKVLHSPGDVNGDGLADLTVIAPQAAASPRIRIVSVAGVPAGSTVLGSGCADIAGHIPALGAFGGAPDVTNGNPAFGLLVSNLVPGATPTMIFGTSTAFWNGTPLPLDLAPLGLQGCALRTSLDVLVPITANLAEPAVAALPLGIPLAPGLVGASITVQAYVPTGALGTLPGALTRAITLVAR